MSGYPACPDHDPVRACPAPAVALIERVDPAAVLRRTIRLHGREATFLESGATSGGPLVALLHGLASSCTTWTRTVELLGRHAHVIAPDLLGHGRSAKPLSGDYSLGAHAAGLRDLLVALGLDGAIESLGRPRQFARLARRLTATKPGPCSSST